MIFNTANDMLPCTQKCLDSLVRSPTVKQTVNTAKAFGILITLVLRSLQSHDSLVALA